MNIEQANRIPMSALLQKLGVTPAKQNGPDIWYLSPLRKERTASFHIHTDRNVWYDHGEGKGGNVVDFVCHYLHSQGEDGTPADALRWLNNMHGMPMPSLPQERHLFDGTASLILRRVRPLEQAAFLRYLDSRGIPLSLAKKYLKEIRVENVRTGREFTALGFPNENNGYELRNKIFKGCIAPKAVSFVRGSKMLHEDIHIFEGFMDFLSALSHQRNNHFEGDAIILNSLSLIPQALPYIKNYSYKTLHSWLDNDEAGKKGTLALLEVARQEKLLLKPMNKLYARHKDVNEWHMQKLGL